MLLSPHTCCRLSPERTAAIPVKLHMPFHPSKSQPQAAAAAASRTKAPVVHRVVAGGNASTFLTRGADEIPDTYNINLLER